MCVKEYFDFDKIGVRLDYKEKIFKYQNIERKIYSLGIYGNFENHIFRSIIISHYNSLLISRKFLEENFT